MNVLMADNVSKRSGWSSMAACNPEDIDSEMLINDALAKAKTIKTDRILPQGAYKVILDHHVAAEVLGMFSDFYFTGSGFHGDGLVSANNIGKQVFHPSLSLWDDACDVDGCKTLFDYEGVLKQKVSLIDEGKIAGAVYDRKTAQQAGVGSTGHAISREKPFIVGPAAQNLFVKPGQQSFSEVLHGFDHGILISRFQYTTLVSPEVLVIAGTTRDGTLLVENGKIKAALPNLSFRVSILNLLQGEMGFDNNQRLMKTDLGVIATPRLWVENFQII
jgi:predicted Zn-dependent protease